MVKLESILVEFAENPLVLGNEDPQEPNVIKLKSNLDLLRVKNNQYFGVLAGMVIVCFVASLVFLILYNNNTTLLTAIYGATGISIGWSVRMMHKIWREKNQTDILYSLIDNLDNQTLQSVASILVRSLYRSN